MTAVRYYVDQEACCVRPIHVGGQALGLTFSTEEAAHSALVGFLEREARYWHESWECCVARTVRLKTEVAASKQAQADAKAKAIKYAEMLAAASKGAVPA